MMAEASSPAASFKFNSFQEIKSHSSILFNERMAILFYLLDMRSISLNSKYDVNDMLEVKSILNQIYKNVRMLLRNNPVVRATLNLDTKDKGIYVPDVALGIINNMTRYCDIHGYTIKRIYIIIQELNKVEMMIKDVLQYFHYFIRPDFRQKPDIEMATERYKEIADKRTVEELRKLVGKRNQLDLDNLGSSRVELQEEIEYDEIVDGAQEDVKNESK